MIISCHFFIIFVPNRNCARIIIIGLTTTYYLMTKELGLPITIVSFFQLGWLIFRPFFLVKIWRIKGAKARIFAFAWTIATLFSVAAFMGYFTPGKDSATFLKLAVGSYATIMVISLSYNAAKSRMEKLRFEKENVESQLILGQQRNEQIVMEKEKEFLQIKTEELERLSQLKSRFIANVSHELRTPLTLLLSPLQTVLKSNDLTVKNDSLIRLAQQNGQRLLQLTNEILDLNKLEAGKLEMQLSNIVLFNFLRQIIAAFQSHADNAKIELNFQYKFDKYLQVKLDKKKTETIIINLLSNALKFTPASGKITVLAKEIQNQLILSVQDTGRGIHPNDLPHIFNRFFQTKQPNSPAEGGTGIGLALSQELAKLMKGSLQVTSEVNRGSTFTLAIPQIEVMNRISDEDAELVQQNLLLENGQAPKVGTPIPITIGIGMKVAPTLGVPQKNGQTTNQTILLVEDNHDLRKYIQSLLLPHYQVQAAENGQAALDYLGKGKTPDLIISDIMMPIMDGYQLLEQLKTSEQYQFIPVIMLTALANAEHKLKALRIGVDDYMLKPFSEEELMARVENLLTQLAHDNM